MLITDELGKRMKNNYELPPRTKLTRRVPVIIRIDGKAFHTFTHNFIKPFDPILMKCMQDTMKYLCENIQGCVFGYTQSDEISLLLTDYKRHTSSAWFDYEIMKICSISSSMATLAFNKSLHNIILSNIPSQEQLKYYQEAFDKGAMFDSRCFNIPKEDVTNYFYWRQLDATRNSIEMVGQAYFSQKELHKKSCNDIQEMLHEQKCINWNDYSVPEKRGSACIKIQEQATNENDLIYTRHKWIIDTNIPIFKGDDREYIDSRFFEY